MSSANSNDATPSLSGLVSSLPHFWQHAPELYFFRIEATFHSAKLKRETDKYYKLVEALPLTILSQVQTFPRDPPTDAPYTKLKAELLRLTSVSDRQRYHALVKEEDLAEPKTQIAQLSAIVAALQLRRFPGPSRRSFGCDRRRSRSCTRTANLCWYHVNYGDKARCCVPPCSFKSTQGNSSAGDRPTLPKPWSSSPSCQLFPIPTFGSLSLTLNIGLRRPFTWIFVIADVPHGILGSDFLAQFDLLVDCRRARLLDRTTGLFVRGLTPFTTPTNLSVLDTDIASPFRQLLLSHPNIINPQFRSVEVQHDVVHHIRTSGPPVFARPRRPSPERFHAAKAEFEHMLQLGIIRPSESPWASPLHMVPKATSGDWRPGGDYRALNNATIPDRYPVPHLQDFAGAIFGKAVFLKIYLLRAFHQIPVAPEDIPKTAVTTPFGLFGFICMPFGLRNAAKTFHRFIDHVLRGLPFVYAYIDDLLVASRNEEEHKEHLALVFDCLDKFGVVVNPSKCVLGVPSLEFLGHQVDSEVLRPLPSKVETVRNFPPPTSKLQ
ncbi:hypothetical protein SprV_0100244500 [Sparganum proliferum]